MNSDTILMRRLLRVMISIEAEIVRINRKIDLLEKSFNSR